MASSDVILLSKTKTNYNNQLSVHKKNPQSKNIFGGESELETEKLYKKLVNYINGYNYHKTKYFSLLEEYKSITDEYNQMRTYLIIQKQEIDKVNNSFLIKILKKRKLNKIKLEIEELNEQINNRVQSLTKLEREKEPIYNMYEELKGKLVNLLDKINDELVLKKTLEYLDINLGEGHRTSVSENITSMRQKIKNILINNNMIIEKPTIDISDKDIEKAQIRTYKRIKKRSKL